MMRLVASSWEVSGIVRVLSAQQFTVTTGIDNFLNGQSNQRPNLVLRDPYAASRTVDHWIDPAAFQAAPAGTYGNLGAVNLAGPGKVQLDMGLSRSFAIREKQSLQLRGEAFNILNHLNADTPIATMNSATFGTILTAQDPRIMQVALKYVF
jgi:hypothetical protein